MFRYSHARRPKNLGRISGVVGTTPTNERIATVKLATIALLSATLLAAPAAAQSLHETHERVWMPAGKSHVVAWRVKGHKAEEAQAHHQAGKHQHLPTRKAPAEASRQGSGSSVGAPD